LADRPAEKSMPQVVQELWDLIVSYFKQETVEPVKGLGRFVAFGVVGSLLLGLGLVLLSVAGLRALQTETGDTFAADWSWAPYFIVLVGAALFAGLAAWRIGKGKRTR
jgi:hypothetical protein